MARAIGADDGAGSADLQVDRRMTQRPAAAVAADGRRFHFDAFLFRHAILILKAGAKTVAPPIIE